MKLKSIVKIFSIFCLLALVPNCARYNPLPLNRLFSAVVDPVGTISFSYKLFNYSDCIQYLGRDILKEGYQPVQITFVNNTNRYLRIAEDSFSFSCAPAEVISPMVHFSVVGRVLGYGIPGLFIWPLLIPAVVDGINASESNYKMDKDYMRKSIRSRLVKPNCAANGLIFVNTLDFDQCFSFSVYDENTHEKFTLSTSNMCMNIKPAAGL